jgi:EmrB/QacA subfamily drug resistance transporter
MVLSLAQFLVILDTSIIGVALPTIQQHFGYSQSALQWIFSAYVIVFGALLLLGGRLSDIAGQRKMFVIGFAILTGASILAGLAPTGDVLISARALQGIGAAFIAPAAMSMVLNLFTVPKERSKAMGIWGAAAPAGGTAGVFLGGMVTAYFDWSWVFLINVPIGIAVLALTRQLLPQGLRQKGKVDFAGAIAITAALIMLVYAIVTANDNGWMSVSTIGLALGSVALLATFVAIQKRNKSPLIPLGIFKVHNLKSSNLVMALLGAAWIPMWFFLNLYLQQVHGYGPFESGLALLPMTAAIMILMVGASARIISRIGIKTSMVAGLSLLAVAMTLFSAMPSSGGSFVIHVLPASLIAAAGMSLAYIPVLMSAVSHAKQEVSGLASGIVNTSYQIGSALGLAIIVAVASSQILDGTNGVNSIEGLNGFQIAFIAAAIIAGMASVIALVAIRKSNSPSEKETPMAAA